MDNVLAFLDGRLWVIVYQHWVIDYRFRVWGVGFWV
jgi:hypothetical protein